MNRFGKHSVRKHNGAVIRGAYVLLEMVVATGLLVTGLAILGGQVQDARSTINVMRRQITAMMLAEQQLAELEMGLVELDSVDEIEEGDFGPRYPNYGWQLITEPTAIENMFLLQLDVMYLFREDDYREDDFDHDESDIIHTVYAMRATPRPLHFGEDFGLKEDELIELADKLDQLGIPGLDVEAFDPRFFQNIDFEELIKVAPLILDAIGLDISQLTGMLPAELLRQIEETGLLDSLNGDGEEGSRP